MGKNCNRNIQLAYSHLPMLSPLMYALSIQYFLKFLYILTCKLWQLPRETRFVVPWGVLCGRIEWR